MQHSTGAPHASAPLSAHLNQKREYVALRTYTRDQQPPQSTIDHTHYGGFPENRIPHRDFTQEKRHFEKQMNRPSEYKEQGQYEALIVWCRTSDHAARLHDSLAPNSLSCAFLFVCQ
jgi:hypothetical protein